jgi:hypothetical protein
MAGSEVLTTVVNLAFFVKRDAVESGIKAPTSIPDFIFF